MTLIVVEDVEAAVPFLRGDALDDDEAQYWYGRSDGESQEGTGGEDRDRRYGDGGESQRVRGRGDKADE